MANGKISRIITDQELFFNLDAETNKTDLQASLFSEYVDKQQVDGLKWLSDKKVILDYGCGTGNTMKLFLKGKKESKYFFYGVDIAGKAIDKIRKDFPKYKFYKISDNKMPQINNDSIEGAYILHVLHHSTEHKEIFEEVYKKMKKNGKFFVCDLSSNNIINKSARSLFIHMPKFVKHKFSDDLVVGESIPEKYKVNIQDIIKKLEEVGFSIDRVGYGHLFFFIFGWIDRFIPFTRSQTVTGIYKQLMLLENKLLRQPMFQNQAEVFFVRCIKR